MKPVSILTLLVVLGSGMIPRQGHTESPHSTPVADNTILLLSLARCCPQQHWAAGEEALHEELQTLNMQTRAVILEMETFEPTRSFFLSVKHQYPANVILAVSRMSDNHLRADILSRQQNEQLSFRQLYFSNESDTEMIPTASLRIIEAVRASMLRVKQMSPQTEHAMTVVPPPYATDGTLRIRIGGALTKGARPGSLCAGAALGLGVMVRKQLLLEIDGPFYAFCSSIVEDGHRASFVPLMVRGFTHWIPDLNGPIRPGVGLGGGLVRVWSRGKSTTSAVNHTDAETVSWFGTAIRMEIRLSTVMGIVVGGTLGTTLPVVQVYFRETAVARWGRPLVEGHFSMEMRIF